MSVLNGTWLQVQWTASCLESLFVTFTPHSRPSTNHLAFIWRLWVHNFWEVYEQGPCGSANLINSVNSQRRWLSFLLHLIFDVVVVWMNDTLETSGSLHYARRSGAKTFWTCTTSVNAPCCEVWTWSGIRPEKPGLVWFESLVSDLLQCPFFGGSL